MTKEFIDLGTNTLALVFNWPLVTRVPALGTSGDLGDSGGSPGFARNGDGFADDGEANAGVAEVNLLEGI